MRLSREACESLAAEYALGTLRGRARARFQAKPIEPPARVWRAIESRIALPRAAAPSYWRSFAMVSGGVASVLLAFLLWTFAAPNPEPDFVAVLMAPDSAPRMVISMHEPDMLKVKMVKPWSAKEGMGLELWAMPRDGKPRSLGMVKNSMDETIIHVAHADPRVQGAMAFAVSLEPMSGSPTGQPTGPVLCSGAIASVRPA